MAETKRHKDVLEAVPEEMAYCLLLAAYSAI